MKASPITNNDLLKALKKAFVKFGHYCTFTNCYWDAWIKQMNVVILTPIKKDKTLTILYWYNSFTIFPNPFPSLDSTYTIPAINPIA